MSGVTLSLNSPQCHDINPPMHACVQIRSTPAASSDGAELQTSSAQRTERQRENRRFKMLCCRCVLPLLALYMLPLETSAAVLPSRNKREISWLDQELFPDRLEPSDLSVGDAGDVDSRAARSETLIASTEELSVKRQNQQHHRANEHRRKVAPLDRIGGFQMSSFRNRKEPDIRREENRD